MEDSTRTRATQILPPAVFKWAHAGVLAMYQQQQQQQQQLEDINRGGISLVGVRNSQLGVGNSHVGVEEGDQVSRAVFDRINEILGELYRLKHDPTPLFHSG